MLKIEIVLLVNNVVLPFQNLKRDFDLDFIELNKLFASKSIAEHGLGFLINIYEGKEDSDFSKIIKQIIFDTGGSNHTFLHNLDIRGYTLYDTDDLILSHWHYDHIGGLYDILERIESPVSIYCHEDALYERFFNRSLEINTKELVKKNREEIIPLLNNAKIVNQLPVNLKVIKELNGKLIMHKNVKKIFEKNNLKITVSGEIKRTHKEESFSNFLINRNEIIHFDEILDDKCLIIEINDSVILINGCCHSGIMNTIDYVDDLTRKPISHIIGGFHMANSKKERIDATLEYLDTYQTQDLVLFPIHCSGDSFIEKINEMNSTSLKAFNLSVGSVFHFYSA